MGERGARGIHAIQRNIYDPRFRDYESFLLPMIADVSHLINNRMESEFHLSQNKLITNRIRQENPVLLHFLKAKIDNLMPRLKIGEACTQDISDLRYSLELMSYLTTYKSECFNEAINVSTFLERQIRLNFGGCETLLNLIARIMHINKKLYVVR